jgi:hypothetical protein
VKTKEILFTAMLLTGCASEPAQVVPMDVKQLVPDTKAYADNFCAKQGDGTYGVLGNYPREGSTEGDPDWLLFGCSNGKVVSSEICRGEVKNQYGDQYEGGAWCEEN